MASGTEILVFRLLSPSATDSQPETNAPANETNAATVPPLLRLPFEIRQKIWKYCQPDKSEVTINCCLSSYPNNRYWLRYNDLESVVPKNLQPLLYVNRQISGEVLALWKGGWIFWFCGLSCASHFIMRVTKRQMGLVGQLHLYRPTDVYPGHIESESAAIKAAWRNSPDIGSDMLLVKVDFVKWHQNIWFPYTHYVPLVAPSQHMKYSHRSIYQRIDVEDEQNERNIAV